MCIKLGRNRCQSKKIGDFFKELEYMILRIVQNQLGKGRCKGLETTF